jgi:hypothetical protein
VRIFLKVIVTSFQNDFLPHYVTDGYNALLHFLSFVIVKFFPNKKGGQENLSLYPPVLTARFGLLNHVPDLLCSASNSTRSIFVCSRHLSLKHSGTRHEYRQVSLQPYSKLPTATINSNGSFTDSSLTKD